MFKVGDESESVTADRDGSRGRNSAPGRGPKRLRPLLILHSYRFIGLAVLVPGVVSADLSPTFAHAAAYGDFVAAILALHSLLLVSSPAGITVAWIFNLWGSADLVNTFYQAGHAGLLAGQLGAAFFLPTLVVPLLLITHRIGFRILLQHQNAALHGRGVGREVEGAEEGAKAFPTGAF